MTGREFNNSNDTGYLKEETLSDKIWSVQKFEKIDWKKRTKILFAENVKEFINIHIEDLDWLWEIHPKIYNRIVAKFKERAGNKLTK